MSRRYAPTLVVVACLAALAAVGRLAVIDQSGPSQAAGSGVEAVTCEGVARVAMRVDTESRTSWTEVEAALRAARGYADPILDDIEQAGGPALSERIDAYRQAIIDVSPALKSLEARQERARHSALAESVLAVWHEMLTVYLDAAPTPAHRRQLEARYPAVAELACRDGCWGCYADSRVASARY